MKSRKLDCPKDIPQVSAIGAGSAFPRSSDKGPPAPHRDPEPGCELAGPWWLPMDALAPHDRPFPELGPAGWRPLAVPAAEAERGPSGGTGHADPLRALPGPAGHLPLRRPQTAVRLGRAGARPACLPPEPERRGCQAMQHRQLGMGSSGRRRRNVVPARPIWLLSGRAAAIPAQRRRAANPRGDVQIVPGGASHLPREERPIASGRRVMAQPPSGAGRRQWRRSGRMAAAPVKSSSAV